MKLFLKHYLRGSLLLSFVLIFISAQQAYAENPPTVTVGAIVPLSGRSAEYGVAFKNGIELAKKNRPELFTNLQFRYEDSLYDGKTSVTTFKKLTTIDHVDLTLVWGHGPVQAVAPLAEAARSPTVVVSGQREVADGKKYVVRFCSPHGAYAGALLKELRRKNYRKIAIVKTEIGFLSDTVDALQVGLKAPETSELIESRIAKDLF